MKGLYILNTFFEWKGFGLAMSDEESHLDYQNSVNSVQSIS